MRRNKRKTYEYRQSPFYCLSSRKKLAKLLFTSEAKLLSLLEEASLYDSFEQPKSKGGFRKIDAPRQDLKRIQSRIAQLLQKITPPDYLFAPVKGRSYVDNAKQHVGASSIRLLDLDDFFPKCTSNKISWFFGKKMKCPPDVTAILRGLVCFNDALPQGSPCSPILAYLSYEDMWDKVYSLVNNEGARLSIYADDITISGDNVPERMVWEVKRTLYKHGHSISKDKERSSRLKPTEITGVIVRNGTLNPPNRSLERLSTIKRALTKSKDPVERSYFKSQICGRNSQLKQIFDARP